MKTYQTNKTRRRRYGSPRKRLVRSLSPAERKKNLADIATVVVDPLLEKLNGEERLWKAGSILGQGSEGQVIRAYDVATGEVFAVKRLFGTVTEAALTQAYHLQQLKHPHLVRCTGSEVLHGALCLYTEYVSGGSLKQRIARKGRLDQNEARRLFKELLSGLAYLHSQQIVHRDLKAANLLLTRGGTLKIADFGACKLLRPDDSGLLKTFKGSLAWSAPEVAGLHGHGRKADIWSAGCTLLEMLTGHAPWAEVGGYYPVLMQLLKTSNTPQMPSELPKWAQSALSLCLVREPESRPTAEELLALMNSAE